MKAFLLLLAVASASLCAPVDATSLNGKVLLGYQGWFRCPSDGTSRGWTHWFRGEPSVEHLTVDVYPDISELTPEERCEVPGFTLNGKPAALFSSANPKTVMRHFAWMKTYGLDGVLVQRFIGGTKRERATGDVVLHNVMAAAKATGRVFAIEYDISGGNEATFAQLLKDDWTYLANELKITEQPGYLHHNGKPVVSVWGMGLNEASHPPENPQTAIELIHWFENVAKTTYMGGTPSRWGTHTADARRDPAWGAVYREMNVIQPWTIGRYGTLAAADTWKQNMLLPDIQLAKANQQLYMPVIFPGFSWQNLKPGSKGNQIPRLRGEFLWKQAYNAKTAGATMLKIAMFDEVDEGTAILKAAPYRKDAPEQGFWLTLDADGADLPSDWYLRIAGAITQMFHGELQPVAALPLSAASEGTPR